MRCLFFIRCVVKPPQKLVENQKAPLAIYLKMEQGGFFAFEFAWRRHCRKVSPEPRDEDILRQ
ncbi:hypothetical protein AM571_PA00292 (plasmid) [Rhizobium etli 8C-3]|uniref:Uncharacterized protein n=1 Tax=Rhizobium etli 8C-3 TaxID=538025 RepID=A0A1L5PAM9_RHIET|nr:hypothetical protein AM571_PA00292 [Rhizobium etli 8C-3]